MARGSFEDFADLLERHVEELHLAPTIAARISAPLMAEAVKDVFGHDPPLATLAPSTQIERAGLGYAANEPLVRTGELRNSVESASLEHLAATGSDNQILAWHTHGDGNYPPRDTFMAGAIAVQPLTRRIWTNIVRKAAGKANL